MKNLFKKLTVMFLALFTLVSCSGTSKHNVAFSYIDANDLKTCLSKASFYDDLGATGAYIFKESEDKDGLHPDSVDYKVFSSVEKEDKANMTKESLKLKRDAFVIEVTLKFKSEDGKKEATYILTTRTTYDEDFIYKNHQDDNRKIGVLTSDERPYKDLKTNFGIAAVEKNDKNEDIEKRIMHVSSNDSVEKAKKVALQIAFNLEYIGIGK